MTVYDVTDDYEEYTRSPETRRLIRERERRLVRDADVVFLTTEELRVKENLRGSSHYVVPNGVDYEHFASAADHNCKESHFVSKIQKPVIGYLGLTSSRMDFELVDMIGQRWPGHVLMVGPVDSRVARRVRDISGVVWTGFVDRRELPHYLCGFDVCILPFQINDQTKRMNPLKVWEYLATGKPLVSVDLPALKRASEVTHIANSRTHFVELIEQCLGQGDDRLGRASQAIAREYSWDVIFNQMMEYLAVHLRPMPRHGD